jgi:hypothetical protein
MRAEEIDRLSILLSVFGRPALLLELGADGGVRRMGTGEGPADGQAYQGTIEPAVFEGLKQRVTDDLLARAGRYTDPEPEGTPTELTVTFGAGGEETGLAFRYGSQSTGPPPPLADLVRAAVAETDGWYGRQIGEPARGPRPA